MHSLILLTCFIDILFVPLIIPPPAANKQQAANLLPFTKLLRPFLEQRTRREEIHSVYGTELAIVLI